MTTDSLGVVGMRRLGSNTALLPVSALLLASLMIASLVGIQGAVDRALNFTSAGSSPPKLGAGVSSMAPILTPRQPAQRAAATLSSATPARGDSLRTFPPVPTVPTLDTGPSIPMPAADALLGASLFDGKGSKHGKARGSWKRSSSKSLYTAAFAVERKTDSEKHDGGSRGPQGKKKKK